MKGALRLFYPPQCLACGEGIREEGALCPDCWRETRFITGAACDCCGTPLPEGEDAGETLVCDDCMTERPPWDRGRAALVYGGAARGMILALKHGDRPDLAPPLAAWLARATAPLVAPGTIVVPVPIHWRRLMTRKYNQAELLAAPLARFLGCAMVPDLLTRQRHTEGQDHKSPEARRANVAGAITLGRRQADGVKGRSVLLVDDVMTSGATLSAATEVLQAAGAGPVSVAVLARAVKQD